MHIVYIDDDSEDRTLFRDILHTIDPSSTCHLAEHGQHGLQVLDALITLPDFIFLDINMPVMNGREVLLAIKRDPRLQSVPVIMYSTTAHPLERQEYLSLGAYRVLVKPSSIIKARELISSVMKEKTTPYHHHADLNSKPSSMQADL